MDDGIVAGLSPPFREECVVGSAGPRQRWRGWRLTRRQRCDFL